MSRGPAYVAGGKLIRDRQLVRCQDRTIKHAWKRIRSNGNRSFLIADAVGRGKSYMALGVAIAFWRLTGKPTFRIVIIARTRELSSAWMKKLAGGHANGPFSDTLGTVEGRHSGQLQDYFGAYVNEFRKRRAVAFVFSVRTRRDALRAQHALKAPELAGPLKKRRGVRRIEVLITSPRFLIKATESPRWRRWAVHADVVIADEAYGMRNDLTAYGRLMRPRRKKRAVFRRRPWLIALSATLLSTAMRDTLGVLSALAEWGSNREVAGRVQALRAACSRYNDALIEALRSSNREATGYNKASTALAKLLRRYMSRIPTLKNRTYEAWLTHQKHYAVPAVPSVRNFPFPRADVDYATVSKALDNEELKRDLALFLAAISRSGDFANAKTRQSYLRLTEIDASNRSWPKPDALKKWMAEHIQRLWKNDSREPRFKVVVYCHHVDTARALVRQGKGSLSESVDKAIREAWRNLAARESALFYGFYTKRRPVLVDALSKARLSSTFLGRLPRRNATLLVAALLNARREGLTRKKTAAFVRTLKGARQVEKDAPIFGLLQRNLGVRVAVLRELDCSGLARWSSSLPVADKKGRALAWFVFNNLRVRQVLERVRSSGDVESMARRIGRLDELEARKLAELVRNALYEDAPVRALLRRWNRDMNTLSRAKEREDLDRDVGHRTKLVEMLTGDNPERRVAVSQDFLTAGNPFLLVLTNVCAMGVDLHHYCWDVIHYSPSWTPSEFEQKSGRIDRPRPRVLRRALSIGAERRSSAIRVHHLIWPFTYDERVLRRMNIRGHLSERLLSSKRISDADDTSAGVFRRLLPLSLAPV